MTSQERFETFTAEQQMALHRKWRQDTHGKTLGAFMNAATGPHGADGYILLEWRGMTLGIEPDGYTHS